MAMRRRVYEGEADDRMRGDRCVFGWADRRGVRQTGAEVASASGWIVMGQPHTPETIVAALGAFPDELGRAVDGYARDDLVRPGQDGGWGVVEVLAHLRDWEEIFLDRVHAIVEQDHPYLPAYDDELWPIERDYRSQDPHQALERFAELREELAGYLAGLPPDRWERVGNHGMYGEITLLWLANHMHEHDQKHLAQVRDVLS